MCYSSSSCLDLADRVSECPTSGEGMGCNLLSRTFPHFMS